MIDIMINIEHVSKQYKLGQIGGTTLKEELQRKSAKIRGKEDPTKKIGEQEYKSGELFMALKDINFRVMKGERVGIIGHNGAGKSTLLKLISRVTAPTIGTIGLNGRITSMLEVGTGFHGELTGRENIYMNGAILGMTKKEIDAKIEDIIEFSEVRQFIDTPVKRYSSGMYVKLAFSVAAHLDSEIMIMDEVLAVGDMAFQKKCLDKMKSAAIEEGRTILYVSHNMNTIRQLCEKCIVLDKGQIVFEGDVEKAIGVYLSNAVKPLETNIDLSEMRMAHLPKKALAKMTHLVLKDKEKAIYDYKETIDMDLEIETKKYLEDLCVRIEIRTVSGIPVGLSRYHDIATMNEGENRTFNFKVNFDGLVNGEYSICLVLYQVDETGNYMDLDAIFPAFIFNIEDMNNQIGINWQHSNWGYVCFD